MSIHLRMASKRNYFNFLMTVHCEKSLRGNSSVTFESERNLLEQHKFSYISKVITRCKREMFIKLNSSS